MQKLCVVLKTIIFDFVLQSKIHGIGIVFRQLVYNHYLLHRRKTHLINCSHTGIPYLQVKMFVQCYGSFNCVNNVKV